MGLGQAKEIAQKANHSVLGKADESKEDAEKDTAKHE